MQVYTTQTAPVYTQAAPVVTTAAPVAVANVSHVTTVGTPIVAGPTVVTTGTPVTNTPVVVGAPVVVAGTNYVPAAPVHYAPVQQNVTYVPVSSLLLSLECAKLILLYAVILGTRPFCVTLCTKGVKCCTGDNRAGCEHWPTCGGC